MLYIQGLNRDNINFNNFINNYSLKACSAGMSKNKKILNYIYRHETLGHLSYINYFLLSNLLYKSVLDFDILDCAYNFSDHNPVFVRLTLTLGSRVKTSLPTSNISNCGPVHCHL